MFLLPDQRRAVLGEGSCVRRLVAARHRDQHRRFPQRRQLGQCSHAGPTDHHRRRGQQIRHLVGHELDLPVPLPSFAANSPTTPGEMHHLAALNQAWRCGRHQLVQSERPGPTTGHEHEGNPRFQFKLRPRPVSVPPRHNLTHRIPNQRSSTHWKMR
jgi:hypothetical protein